MNLLSIFRKGKKKKHLTFVKIEIVPAWVGQGEEALVYWRCSKTGEVYFIRDSAVGGNRYNPVSSFSCLSCGGEFSGLDMDQPWVSEEDVLWAIRQ